VQQIVVGVVSESLWAATLTACNASRRFIDGVRLAPPQAIGKGNVIVPPVHVPGMSAIVEPPGRRRVAAGARAQPRVSVAAVRGFFAG
jgi:hypothetical protein